MKKFYFLIVAMLVGLAVSAQNGAPLYAVGDFEGCSWTEPAEGATAEFKWKGSFYTIDLKQCANFKISTTTGSWAAFDEGALQCAKTLKADEPQDLFPGTADIVLEGKADWTITVSGDLKTITAKAAGEIADAKYYIRGAMNEWGTEDAWEMTLADGKLTSKTVTIAAGVEFKIADENWGEVNYGGAPEMVASESYELIYNADVNCSMAEDFTGVVTFDLESHMISFAEGGEPVTPPTPPTPGDSFNVYYDNTETAWATPYIYYWPVQSPAWPGVKMVKLEDNLWGYTLPAGTTGLIFNAGDGDASKTEDLTPRAGAVYNHDGDTGDDCDLPIEEIPYEPVKFYLRGELNGWGYNEATTFEYADGTYTLHLDALEGQFVIANHDWSIKFGADAHGEEVPEGKGYPVEANTTSKFWLGSCNAETVDSWTNVAISFVYAEGDQSIDVVIAATVSGVENIAADANVAAEYFNLQGVRVANPENGLYIVRRGNTVSKVLVK